MSDNEAGRELAELVEKIEQRWPPVSQYDKWSLWADYLARMWPDLAAGIRGLQERVSELEGDAEVVELQLRVAWKQLRDLEQRAFEEHEGHLHGPGRAERLEAVARAAQDYIDERWSTSTGRAGATWGKLNAALVALSDAGRGQGEEQPE